MRPGLFFVLAAAGALAAGTAYRRADPAGYAGLEAAVSVRAAALKELGGLFQETLGPGGAENRERVKLFADPGLSYKMAAELARAEGDAAKELAHLERLLTDSADPGLRAEAEARAAELRREN